MDPIIPYPDLTQRPPRSMRQCLGGFVLLPPILDKGRSRQLQREALNLFTRKTK
jgi:hypothetical protein